MKVVRYVEVLVLLIAAVALTYVYVAFREQFFWALGGFAFGLVSGSVLTVLVGRGLRKRDG